MTTLKRSREMGHCEDGTECLTSKYDGASGGAANKLRVGGRHMYDIVPRLRSQEVRVMYTPCGSVKGREPIVVIGQSTAVVNEEKR